MDLKKRPLTNSIVIVLLAIGIVATLTTHALVSSNVKNGFNRFFKTKPVSVVAVSKNIYHLVDIMGCSNNTIYLRNIQSFFTIKPNRNYLPISEINVELKPELKRDKIFTSFITSSNLLLFYTNTKTIVENNLTTNKSFYHRFRGHPFYHVVPISQNSFIYRAKDTAINSKNISFFKETFNTGIEAIKKDTFLATDEYDMSTDGLYSFDPISQKITYTCFYSNNILILDTNLTISKAHTIDTFKCNQTKMGIIESGNHKYLTNIVPAHMINWSNSSYGKLLYINSKVKADNEPYKMFQKSDVIDIYELMSGKYIDSFSLPTYDNEHFITFKMIDNTHILAIYKNHIVYYQI